MAYKRRYVPTDKEVLNALWVLVRELKIGGGRMVQIKYPALREAFRILSLRSGGGAWQETRGTWHRLEAAGLDPQKYQVVDHDAFRRLRAYLAAIKEPKERRKRQEAALEAELGRWPTVDTSIKPKVTEGYKFVNQLSDDDGQKQSSEDDPTFRLYPSYTDNQYKG